MHFAGTLLVLADLMVSRPRKEIQLPADAHVNASLIVVESNIFCILANQQSCVRFKVQCRGEELASGSSLGPHR